MKRGLFNPCNLRDENLEVPLSPLMAWMQPKLVQHPTGLETNERDDELFGPEIYEIWD